MICSSETIKSLKIITPFRERYICRGVSGGRSHAGYDIALNQTLLVKAGGFTLGSSMERFKMPKHIMGCIFNKSTHARQGIMVWTTIIEPGWEGYLTLELVNHSDYGVVIQKGTPIAQVVFHTMDRASEGYSGKYNHQPNHPVEAIFDE